VQERAQRRSEIQQALRDHHMVLDSSAAHPVNGFNLPEWSGNPQYSAAALLGGAPTWAAA